MNDILYIILLSLLSLATLFFLAKLMGYRQMSQLSMFDYINGITIGSIAAELATSLDENFIYPLTAMIVYSLVTTLLSLICSRFIPIRHFVEGYPILLLHHNTLYEKNFKKVKLDLSEFMVQCRINGYFNLSDLDSAILEPNGNISFLPKSTLRPVNPKDLELFPNQDVISCAVILDGKIMEENLKHAGKDTIWLQKQLSKQGALKAKEIFLATCDLSNQLTIYTKNHKSNKSFLS